VSVSIRSNQPVAFHNHPLIRVFGAVLINPIHFAASVAGWDHSHARLVLKAVCEA
jgi:hypothetical protein